MGDVKTTIGEGGRIVIPAVFRRALDLIPGDEVVLQLEERGIRILSVSHAIKYAQEAVQRHNTNGRSLSQELIKQRREEITRG
jgi:AbrB family looped-hinge helix DNA binding protein